MPSVINMMRFKLLPLRLRFRFCSLEIGTPVISIDSICTADCTKEVGVGLDGDFEKLLLF
jgi:hypothetical protein